MNSCNSQVCQVPQSAECSAANKSDGVAVQIPVCAFLFCVVLHCID